MAGGGKETPRQKMIGMMYLFLTAMLAINVSDSLLHRFLFINNTLEVSRDQTVGRNSNYLSNIQKAVEDRKNQAEDIQVLQKATQVRQLTQTMLSELDELKDYLIEETGGYDSENQLLGFKDSEFIAHHMIQQKHAEELKSSLNSYVSELSNLSGMEFEIIAHDGDTHPMFKNDPNQKKKEFAELFFEGTPLAAGLATITQFENEVLAKETEALEHLAGLVGAKSIDFDQINAMVRPVSQRVAAGTKYEADLFIAASSSALTPTMFLNGDEIRVDSGMGKISFTASPGDYNAEGIARKTYQAQIQLNVPGKGDTTFTQTVEYFVVKPVIQIQSTSVNALYFRCGNELTVNVPALGTSYSPTFRASGATVVPGNKTGVVTLIPTAGKVELSVYNDGNLIGTQPFSVRGVPRPEVQIQIGGRQVDTQRGIKSNQLQSISAVVIPDEDFRQMLPKDARYRVTKWKVTLASGSRPKAPPIEASDGEINLNRLRQLARPGDRLVVEVVEVLRLNYQGQTEPVKVGFVPMTIPIN